MAARSRATRRKGQRDEKEGDWKMAMDQHDPNLLTAELEISCARCGATESQWPGVGRTGFVGKGGEIYCCEACAQGKACACNLEQLDSLVKKASA